MENELLGKIISKIKPLNIIIDRESRILWISEELENKITARLCREENIKNIVKWKFVDLGTGKIILIDEEKYIVSRDYIEDLDLTIIILDPYKEERKYKDLVYVYEKIIDNLNDGVLLTDREGVILLYNKAMEDLEKRKKEKMVGRKIWNAYGYKDESKSEHMGVFKSKKAIINKYKAHAYNKGNPIFKSYSTIPIKKDNETWGVYTISKDETKLRSLLSEIIDLKRQFNIDEEGSREVKNNGTRYNFAHIVGSSEKTKKVIGEAQAVAWLDNSILLVGETGTGKEVFAQSIHNYGKRKDKPFIGINCSAIPENLLESILFDSVKGAYTGALDSSGLFEEAAGGTLFLDELNSMPISMQTKLLRALQERMVRRVGGKENYHIKCRLVSAMNEDPYKLIKEGRLRQDLFYRIAGYNIYIPRLIERSNDIFDLTKYYIRKYNSSMNKNISDISLELKKLMKTYSWPGNVRELSHFVENIMIRTKEEEPLLRRDNIPDYILDIMNVEANKVQTIKEEEIKLQDKLDRMEKKLILKELDRQMWNVSGTAKDLGITRQSLIYRMKKFNIERKK